MEFKSKVRGHLIKSQGREIVSNVLNFMTLEKKGELQIPLAKVQERVKAATGVSSRTISRISVEKKQIDNGQSSQFVSPRKEINKIRPITDIDDFHKGVLKQIILNLYSMEKVSPTMKTILAKFKKDTSYEGCSESLRTIVKSIGFSWRKTRTKRKILMERHDIQKLRVDYLRAIKSYREEGRPIIYLDETYIHASHTRAQSWHIDTNEGLLEPLEKGQRLIIVTAGGQAGFVPYATLVFKSNCKTGDYHDEMNYANFTKWLEERLIPNLPERSVLVINNAPYHNVQIDKAPTTNSTKAVMIEWLCAKNVPVDDSLLKTDLYSLVLQYKPKVKRYAIDETLRQYGHNILRLPPYHPDLNPIELVWASLKPYVANKNVTFQLNDVRELCEEFLNNFSPEAWQSRCEHVVKCEKEFLLREGNIDDIIESFVINLQDDTDDTDETSSEEEDYD